VGEAISNKSYSQYELLRFCSGLRREMGDEMYDEVNSPQPVEEEGFNNRDKKWEDVILREKI